jgi:hypothetical protein
MFSAPLVTGLLPPPVTTFPLWLLTGLLPPPVTAFRPRLLTGLLPPPVTTFPLWLLATLAPRLLATLAPRLVAALAPPLITAPPPRLVTASWVPVPARLRAGLALPLAPAFPAAVPARPPTCLERGIPLRPAPAAAPGPAVPPCLRIRLGEGRTTGPTHHTHAIRPGADAEETTRSLLQNRDHHLGSREAQRFEPVLDGRVQCLAFEHIALVGHRSPLSCASRCGGKANHEMPAVAMQANHE